MSIKKTFAVFILIISMLFLNACRNSDHEKPNKKEAKAAEKTEKTADPEKLSNSRQMLDLKKEILNPSSQAVLLSKQYSLSKDYIPKDLVALEVTTVLNNPEINQLRKEAADALKSMFEDAEKSGIVLSARSGYRSYQTQMDLFESYALSYGKENASLYSANAGESEHQTGLAIDVTSRSVNYRLVESFGETPEGMWISENAHRYGFIIRYPKNKEEFTGYRYEPWHLRYLGEKLATDVYESGLSYEEYLLDGGIHIEIKK